MSKLESQICDSTNNNTRAHAPPFCAIKITM
uniref:Uncharacterized protein n=1 Tax=Arundo donax TaxID=35708 RepID=A0A0A9BDI7_ARUDO